MIRVLFVCSGNICRSPMAEAVFRRMVEEAGLSDKIAIDSAGTGPWHVGERADRRARKELAKHGIRYDGRGRQLSRSDFEDYDYILAMDRSNLRGIQRMAPNNAENHISMYLDFAPDIRADEVPDPYYEGGFDHVYNLVSAAGQGLLAHLKEVHGL